MKWLIVLLAVSSVLSAVPQNPVIGIYTQDAPNSIGAKTTYIAASYVKYLEAAGAQVIPLFYKQSRSELEATLNKINGVLFTGGDMDINITQSWTETARIIVEHAKSQNEGGKVFPLLGICLGHQLLSYLTSGYDDNWIQRVDGEAPVVNNITLTANNSYIFSKIPENLLKAATEKSGVLYFSHHWAVYTSFFNNSQQLTKFWNLVAKTTSSHGQQFVSAQEAKNYPFYSFQFHPEKNQFEWRVDANRTADSIDLVQRIANNFVEKARQSSNRFSSQSELVDKLIYRYGTQAPPLQYSLQSFQEIYLFSENN